MKRNAYITLTAGLAALALVACSASPDPGGGNAPPETEGQTSGTAGSPAGEAREVSVQLYAPPSSFSPFIAQTGGNELIESLHWDSLIGLDASNNLEPRLAESWSVSDDGLVWTFNLREGLTWSDGEPFTASDAVFTFNIFANPATGSARAGAFTTVEGANALADGSSETASGFTAPDDTTFVMTLTEPNTAITIDLIGANSMIVPEHIYGDLPIEDFSNNPAFREPEVGIGPFLFTKWISDDQLEFTANPSFRNEVELDRVFATFMATDTAQAQLQAGEVDFAQVAAADAQRMKEVDGIALHDVGGVGIMALHNAFDSGKLADSRVRQAILYSIDRDAIVDQVLDGYGEVVDTIIHGPAWAMPDDLTHYSRDVDKAKALLAEAGWDAATEVSLEIVPGPKDREQILTIIAGQMQEVGINAVVKQVDSATLSDLIAARDFDLLISGYGVFNVDPAAMNSILLCDNGALSGYCDPELDKLLLEGVTVADQDARAEIYHEALKLVNENVPIFPIYVPNTLAATSERLQGFELNPMPTNAFWNISEWSIG